MRMFSWDKQANPGIRQITPYQPGKSLEAFSRELGVAEVIKLASNENPRGPSKKVLEAIYSHAQALHLYPDQYELLHSLSKKLSVPVECLTIGNGSNDVLDLVARVFLAPDRSAVVSTHCFLVYPLIVKFAGARLKTVAAQQDYGHDLDAMLAAVDASTAVVFIANPNNPTGTWISHNELQQALSAIPEHVVVVLDEAYFEYVQHPDYPNGAALIEEHKNLVVTRTFSKVYGLASARVGYALSHPEIADLLNRVRQPFNVNGLALAAATAALQDDDYIEESIRLNTKGMAELQAGLAALQLPFIAGTGNFVTFNATGRGATAMQLYDSLLKQGVIVRPLANYQMPDHLRVTVGLPEQNQRFLQALASS